MSIIESIEQGSVYYPRLLGRVKDSPDRFYCLGDKSILKRFSFAAVVGSRAVTPYGSMVTRTFTRHIALLGYTIVSGLMYGVDSIAHKTALDLGVPTIGVVGYGLEHLETQQLDYLMPHISPQNKNLLLISPFPPEQPPARWTFAKRNKLIASMSEFLVVTEASENSGSLLTARHSLALKRPVFAIAKDINSPNSQGLARISAEGASVIMSTQVLSTMLGISFQNFRKIPKNLSSEKQAIIKDLAKNPSTITDLNLRLTISPVKLLLLLAELEQSGYLYKSENLYYAK